MPLSLWGQQLVGNKVPADHNFFNVMQHYLTFRQKSGGDLRDFEAFLMALGFAPGGVNTWCYPLGVNQFNIALLNISEIELLKDDPLGRFSRIFLYQWYRCHVNSSLPRCLADVFIVGYLRGRGFVGPALRAEIVALGYAGGVGAAGPLIHVGNGIGTHFGFLDASGLPTAFFNSFFY
ncbi:MAG: hypothetical protein PHU14_12670 [Methylovulum sp.]|nr:hypothetical protein [Methylovulum sp.]